MDINNKEFRKVLRGYDADEVDEFLESVSEDYESIYKENSSCRDKIVNLEEKLQHYSKIENTIQNTLLLAQNSAEQAKQSAQKEAELIVRNANDTAQRILDKANNDVVKVNDDYDRLKQEFIKFRTKYRNFMNSQMEIFNEMENDFQKNFNVGAAIEENIKEKEVQKTTGEDEFNIKAVEKSGINFNDDLNEIKSFFVEEK